MKKLALLFVFVQSFVFANSPAITVTKVATVDHVTGTDSETTTGDTIVYTITIANTGNVTLTGIDITDTMTDGAGQSLTLTSPATFSTYTLAPGETEDIQATYTIEQSAADTGSISNTVSVDGTAPDGTEVSDDLDAPVVVNTTLEPSIEVIKTATITDQNGDGITGLGDIIQYTITVENTGNVTLVNLSLTDTLTFLNGDSLASTISPSFVSNSAGSPMGTLKPSEIANYLATYFIEQSAVDAGGLNNTATAICTAPDGGTIIDISDDGDTGPTDTGDDPTITPIIIYPGIQVTKTATIVGDGDGYVGENDLIDYTIQVTNTGNVTLYNVDLTDTLTDGNGNSLSIDTSAWVVRDIVPGETEIYQANYIIEQSAAESGSVSNSVTATATDPDGIHITAVSDDPNTSLNNDATVTIMSTTPPYSSIELTKAASVSDTNGDGSIGIGDTITYTIVATNKGGDVLTNVTISDQLSDLNGNALTLTTTPAFVSSTQSSPTGTLEIGEQATYRATYVVNNQAMNAGGVSNTATVTAQGTNSMVTDTSDDPMTSTPNDATITTLTTVTPQSTIEVTKTATITDNGNGTTGLGDTITFLITVENTGNTLLNGVVVNDTFSDLSGNALILTSGPFFVSPANLGSGEGTLMAGETATYTATFIVNAQADNAGGVSNSASATATTPSGNTITDVSDDGDDTDGNPTNDPTIVHTDAAPVSSIKIQLNGNTSAENNQIKNVADPTEPQDAATKAYADALVSNLGLMNFNGWNNFEVWNDDTTLNLISNSFVFLNADNTTLVLPDEAENGDVIYIYVMRTANSVRPTTLKTNNFTIRDRNENQASSGQSITGVFQGGGGLQIIIRIGDYWMAGGFQKVN